MKRFATLFLLGAFAFVPGTASADISNMDIGGDLFLLFYYGENTDDLDDSMREEVDFLRTEAHLWFQADLADNVMVRISLEADRAMESWQYQWDNVNNAVIDNDPNQFDRNHTDLDVFLEEAYMQVANIYDSSLSILAGRQFMTFGDNPHADNFNKWWGGSFWFGDGNMMSPDDIADIGTWETDPFDALVLEWDLDTAIVDVWYAQAVDDPGPDDLDVGVWAINASYIGMEGHQLDGYFAYTDGDFSEVNMGEIEQFVVGARLAGDCMTDVLSYKAEVAYNFGDIDNGGIPGVALNTVGDGDFEGFGAEAGINWHPEYDMNPNIGFIYTWLEGDENNVPGALNQDEDFDGFISLFEDKTYGEILDPNSNVHIFHVSGGLDLNESWSLCSDWYYFLLDEDGNDVTMLGFANPADDDDLGFEWDLQLDYQFNEEVGAFAGGGVFWPGDGAEDLAGSDDEAYFFRTGVKVVF